MTCPMCGKRTGTIEVAGVQSRVCPRCVAVIKTEARLQNEELVDRQQQAVLNTDRAELVRIFGERIAAQVTAAGLTHHTLAALRQQYQRRGFLSGPSPYLGRKNARLNTWYVEGVRKQDDGAQIITYTVTDLGRLLDIDRVAQEFEQRKGEQNGTGSQ